MSEVFAKRLVLLRQKAGISQREAADALQISQSLLSHYERGIREPGLSFVSRAAAYYGVTTDLLLGRLPEEHEQHPRPEEPPLDVPHLTGSRDVTDQELRDTLDLLLDMVQNYADPVVEHYARIYLSEVMYELLRQVSRDFPEYDQSLFSLSDESFDSGALLSELSWTRSQYVMALNQSRQTRDSRDKRDGPTTEELSQRYGERYQSMLCLLRRVGHRVARQDVVESMMSQSLLRPTVPQNTDQEEDSL
jgi:transcriptional regulator with XRE-family HTH domain